jgi:hypothetical protein
MTISSQIELTSLHFFAKIDDEKKKKEKIAKVRLIYFYIDVLFQGTCEHVI